MKSKKMLQLLLDGVLAFVIWNIAAFIGYSFTGTGDKPTLIGSLIALIIILPATFYLGTRFGGSKSLNPLAYSALLTLFVLVLNLLITIPNGTTKVFFGNWAVYLTFLSIFAGSYLGASKTSK